MAPKVMGLSFPNKLYTVTPSILQSPKAKTRKRQQYVKFE